MTQWQTRSKRKKSGKLMHRLRKKKKMKRARDYLPMHVGEKRVKNLRVRGGRFKLISLSGNIANVVVKGKTQKTKILGVLENAADPHYVRRNIVTKGAIINTELGKARVTSKPGRDGIVNAISLEEKK